MPERLTGNELFELETCQLRQLDDWEVKELQGYLRRVVEEIRASRKALRVLHAAYVKWPCPLCASAEAWESEALDEIRRAIEEEAT